MWMCGKHELILLMTHTAMEEGADVNVKRQGETKGMREVSKAVS